MRNATTKEEYIADIWDIAKQYSDQRMTLAGFDICDTNDVIYKTEKRQKYAYVQEQPMIREAGTYSLQKKQTFILKLEDNGHWKIHNISDNN